MNCRQLTDNLDDYLDGRTPAADAAAIEAHAAGCDACNRRLDEARRVRDLVRDWGRQTEPAPDPEFLRRAMQRAVHRGARVERRRWWLTGFGSAAAAALAIWLLGLVLPDGAAPPASGPGVQTVAVSLESPRTVRLVFTAEEALDDARLTVLLPEGVRITGLGDRREVTWVTSLAPGRNILPLELVATSPAGGELLATLRHGDDDRTFRLRVTVDQGARLEPAREREYIA